MRMLDLFCGRLGWSRVFAARGWKVVAVDLVEPPEIPQGVTFIKADVLSIYFSDGRFYATEDSPIRDRYHLAVCQFVGGSIDPHPEMCDKCGNDWSVHGKFDFICASSPCEQFSVHGMKHFHPNPPYPELGIRLFEHTRALCEASGVPYVMENVRVAQDFVGRATHHCGPFYLWGNGVPMLMAQGINKKDQGFRALPGNERIKALKAGMDLKTYRNTYQHAKERKAIGAAADQEYHVPTARKIATSHAATIPPELANCVADYAERLIAVATPETPQEEK